MHPDEATAWQLWFDQHGIPNSGMLRAGSDVVCDDDKNTVTVLRLVPDFPDAREVTENYQLEAPALPMPECPDDGGEYDADILTFG